ncbi:Uncharacterised protein [Mycobacteroides abscessus]|nr:Uncharacterised protein [Mycobacteroides abscessus]
MPVLALPKPTILPPDVEVVRNQASTENRCGPVVAVGVLPETPLAPEKRVAFAVGGTSLPSTPRVVPFVSARSDSEAQSVALLPLASFIGQ